MTTQTFRAPNMAEALEKVQREFGPEALIVSVRQIPTGPAWQVWGGREVEVLALPGGGPQIDEPDMLDSVPALPAPARPDAAPSPEPKPTGSVAASVPEAMIQARRILQRAELSPARIRQLLETCAETLSPASLTDPLRLRVGIKDQLRAPLKIRRPSVLARDRIICLSGLRGSGKTTTAAKLAAHLLQTRGQHLTWVCADTMHLAALAEARIVTETLGISLHVAYSPEELQAITNSLDHDETILVDMPGFNPQREAEIIEQGAFLTALPGRSLYYLAPATAKAIDLEAGLTALRPFHPQAAILTRLDETVAFGGLYELIADQGMPLAYFTSSPQVMAGLDLADPKRLVDALYQGDYQ
ncbi:MAG TPA: hypothetical protein VF982_02650 [Anaerolineales bacterium]